MPTRPPAVAGTFYEAQPARLRVQVEECFAANAKSESKERFIGAVVPHAGLMYSGHVAAAFYGLAEFPLAVIAACLVRPAFRDDDVLTKIFGGWLDTMFAGVFSKISEK